MSEYPGVNHQYQRIGAIQSRIDLGQSGSSVVELAGALLALFAGNYLSGAFERGGAGKVAAIVALGYLAATGLLNLQECLLYRYH